MNKPLLKDAWSFFIDDNNWIILWEDKKTGLTISKLEHLPLLRLVLWNHTINCYVHYQIHPLLYFPNCKKLEDMHHRCCFTSVSEREIKDMVKYQWEDEQ